MTEPRVKLADLGWDESWRAALAGDAAAACDPLRLPYAPGRVAYADAGTCTVVTSAGTTSATLGAAMLDAVARDAMAAPCPGDWCLLREWPDGPSTVEALAPRRTVLAAACRGEPGRSSSSHQAPGPPVAANLDLVALVVPLRPAPDLGCIHRLMAVAADSDAAPVLVLVLSEAGPAADAEQLVAAVRAADLRIEVARWRPATGGGLATVRTMVRPGRTMVLVGASGRVTAKLTNALVGAAPVAVPVTPALVVVPGGGAVIDTRGALGRRETDRLRA